MAENGRRVGRDEELVLADPDDDRRAVAHRDNFFGVVRRDRHERKESPHVQERSPSGILELVVGRHLLLEQVRDDLGIGFRDERVPELLQLVLQVQVVLDDAVVHDDDLAGAVLVRMGVLLRGPAVRGPARVADAVDSLERLRVDGLLEVHELARAAPSLDLPVADDGDACGVVAAIFEPPQPVDEDGHDFLRAEIADDSAHIFLLSTFYLLVSFLLLDPPVMFRCFPPLTARAPAGTFSRTVVPLPT